MTKSTLDLQDRFLSDIEKIVHEKEAASQPRNRIVMLSGGIDSLLLVVVLQRLFPNDEVHTIHVQGIAGQDSRGALAVASRFKTIHHVFEVTLDDILDNLHRVKGRGYTGLSRLISHICYELCFEWHGIDGCNVYHGDGADALYGNAPRVYRMAEQLVQAGKYMGLDEAKTEAKVICYPEAMRSMRYFAALAERFGAKAIMPYTDARLVYLTEMPFAITGASNKSFVKDAMKRRYDLDDIVQRPRVSMQAGIGLRDALKDALLQRFASHGRSIRRIVRSLSA